MLIFQCSELLFRHLLSACNCVKTGKIRNGDMKTQLGIKNLNEFVGKQSEMLHSCAMCGGHQNCEIISQMQTARSCGAEVNWRRDSLHAITRREEGKDTLEQAMTAPGGGE
jgi:phage terminase large subunit GpA-like protein